MRRTDVCDENLKGVHTVKEDRMSYTRQWAWGSASSHFDQRNSAACRSVRASAFFDKVELTYLTTLVSLDELG